ncbi:hypothetical protein CONLIGDRAFT_141019 [Coniochaeta ligniaria NRRL 30616]|uniref:Uncharacterized protein n=1 Tax=Coniochaeta ligniaria NRRL 30616 TaxID=1408157 RepID=A0A1J7J1H4_9PEZI|nr:hypothetical protein CONLIGDRAFT_141019 [Coniochaeta ligniaria NRRL 30616]
MAANKPNSIETSNFPCPRPRKPACHETKALNLLLVCRHVERGMASSFLHTGPDPMATRKYLRVGCRSETQRQATGPADREALLALQAFSRSPLLPLAEISDSSKQVTLAGHLIGRLPWLSLACCLRWDFFLYGGPCFTLPAWGINGIQARPYPVIDSGRGFGVILDPVTLPGCCMVDPRVIGARMFRTPYRSGLMLDRCEYL